jgi:hypothetical protein
MFFPRSIGDAEQPSRSRWTQVSSSNQSDNENISRRFKLYASISHSGLLVYLAPFSLVAAHTVRQSLAYSYKLRDEPI